MYYNKSTKETKSIYSLKILLNASIPDNTEQVGEDWFLLHNGVYPEADADHRVEEDGVALVDGKYTRQYKLVELTEEEKQEKQAQEQEEKLARAKEERAEQVSHITVEVDGMVFDGDEKAQDRMSRVAAIASEEELSTELPWVLADNTVAIVTVAQIKEALRKALYAQAELWVVPYISETESE